LPTNVERVIDNFMTQVEQVTDDEDWAESDGWVGRMILWTDGKPDQVYVYEITDGKMRKSESEGPFVSTIQMSVQTLLDLLNAAFRGRGDDVYIDKYHAGHIVYDGGRWIVDSERFRKVFARLAASRVRS